MKKVFDWVLTVNLILVFGLSVYLWWSGQLVVQYVSNSASEMQLSTEEEATLFATTVRAAVDAELGQPTEGYEPGMFLAVYPGLAATDFEGVEASIGKYVVVEGQLVHVTPPDVPLHSAVKAISNRGLRTLLENIATRGQIDLAGRGTITEVFDTLTLP